MKFRSEAVCKKCGRTMRFCTCKIGTKPMKVSFKLKHCPLCGIHYSDDDCPMKHEERGITCE